MKQIKVEKTVTEQVLDLPTGSVVLVHDNGYDHVLHRTGVDGWLVTREIGSRRGYLPTDYVRNWLKTRESSVFLLTD
jgi:hypothetical protein